MKSSSSLAVVLIGSLGAVAACGGSDAKDVSADAARPDAPTTDGAPAQTVCEAHHVVCGSLGDESCGTCPFEATCLPDQTGCLEVRPVNSNLPLPSTAVDIGDRLVFNIQTPSGISFNVAQISNGGTFSALETVSQPVPIVQTSATAYWQKPGSTGVRSVAQQLTGVQTVSFPVLPEFCRGLAVNGLYMYCAGSAGISQHSVRSADAAAVVIAPNRFPSAIAASDTRLYYIEANTLYAMSLTEHVELTLQTAPTFGSIALLGVTSDELFVEADDASGERKIWRVAHDAAAVTEIFVGEQFDVLGVARGEVIVSERVPDQRVGRVVLGTRAIEPLLVGTGYTIATANKRDHEYVFLASWGSNYLLRLPR